MGRRALSLAAIILWLGAGVTFAVLGVRSIRIEEENAVSHARRLAEATVESAVRTLPTAVSDALEREPTERFRIVTSDSGPSAGSAPPISAEDRLLLDQAAYVERAGNPTEAAAILARLTDRKPLDLAAAIACLRAGALARARGDRAHATPLLERASAAPAGWRDPNGLAVSPAASHLLAPEQAAVGNATSLTRLLDASDDGRLLPMTGHVDLPDLLLTVALDVAPFRARLSRSVVARLDTALHRAALGREIERALADRGVAVVDRRIAYRSVDGPPTIVVTTLENVRRALSVRADTPVVLANAPAPKDVPFLRAAAPLASLYLWYPGWEATIAPPVGIATLGIGLALYVLGGLFAILWFVRQARASRMQADFVAAVSHEMKTPIAGIQAMAEMLADGRVADPARAHAYAERIRAEASRLGAGVRNVLDAARIERDPSSIVRPRPTEPSALVLDLASVMRPVLEGRGFRFTVTATPSPRPIPIDPDAFGSVVGNLLDNAAKFSTETKEIEVDAGPVAHGYRVSVSDRGPGVPERERARVFERFERGEHARRMAIPGVGLGLHVAKNLVSAHRGTIEVRAREGGGAVFVVEWPEGAQ